jgi:hypothetical protein
VDLPPEVERLLLDVVADGFTVYCCGPKSYPLALVAAYEWPGWVDLVTIRGLDLATAARVPKHGPLDVFAPPTVVWAYQGRAEPTLRALLGLVHPDHPEAPRSEHPAPPSLLIPRSEQRPMSIRLPPPGQTAARAARLAASAACRP